MIPLSPLFTIGKFLWKYKAIIGVVVAVGVIAGTMYFDKKSISNLTEKNANLESENEGFKAAILVLNESHAAQIKSLESEAIDKKARDDSLDVVLREVKENDEQIECAMPDFVRNAFERM